MRAARAAAVTILLAGCASGNDTATPPTASPSAATTIAPSTVAAPIAVTTSTTAATTTVPPTTAPPTTVGPTSLGPLDSPERLAAELSRVELALRTAIIDSPEADAAGRAQQRVLRALADRPEWDDAVIAGVDPTVRDSVALTIGARRAVVAHAATRPRRDPPTTLPAWTIREPEPAARLLGWYREAEAATGVPWNYLAAINFVETRFGRIVGASPDGALGPMQFLPTTWAECCTGDITDDRDAILGAATYLKANGAPDDMLRALDAYNPNAGYVGAVDAYARNLALDERALHGYHAWEVYATSSAGSIRLPVGYSTTEPLDAAEYARTNPDDVEG